MEKAEIDSAEPMVSIITMTLLGRIRSSQAVLPINLGFFGYSTPEKPWPWQPLKSG